MSTLEEQIIQTVNAGIGEAIKSRLANGYANNPLTALIDSVVSSRLDKLRTIVEEAVDGALFGQFRENLQQACAHKLAKIIVSKCEGEIERRANDLRSSPEFRAKVTLAIEQAVKSVGQP